MERAFLKKEEPGDEDSQCLPYKIVKKEEDIPTKCEDNDYNSKFPSMASFRTDSLTLDWKSSQPNYSYLFPQNTGQINLDTKYTYQIGKPFIIIRLKKETETYNTRYRDQRVKSIIEKPKLASKKEPNAQRETICKNYIGLLCAGFSRTILTAENDCTIMVYIKDLVNEKKQKYESILDSEDDELVESLKMYIHKIMCGKKARKTNEERDFKISNTRDLVNLYRTTERDSENILLFKKIIKKMIVYFFESEYFNEWLQKGMIAERNKLFFMWNKDEIQRKFEDPEYYKPKFICVPKNQV